MPIGPRKLNSSTPREVTSHTVKEALDPKVERAQLNRILEDLNSRIEESQSGNGNGNGVTAHGSLTGLGNDDHIHYHTAARAFTWLMSTLLPQSGVDLEEDAGVPEILLFILTTVGTAGENLAAGDFVSIELTSGEVLLADASTNDLMADGFVLEAYSSGATNVRVYYGAENNELAGLTAGHTYYLSADTPGGVTDTPPTGDSPIIVQQLGRAKSSTSLLVNIQQAIERPE